MRVPLHELPSNEFLRFFVKLPAKLSQTIRDGDSHPDLVSQKVIAVA